MVWLLRYSQEATPRLSRGLNSIIIIHVIKWQFKEEKERGHSSIWSTADMYATVFKPLFKLSKIKLSWHRDRQVESNNHNASTLCICPVRLCFGGCLSSLKLTELKNKFSPVRLQNGLPIGVTKLSVCVSIKVSVYLRWQVIGGVKSMSLGVETRLVTVWLHPDADVGQRLAWRQDWWRVSGGKARLGVGGWGGADLQVQSNAEEQWRNHSGYTFSPSLSHTHTHTNSKIYRGAKCHSGRHETLRCSLLNYLLILLRLNVLHVEF